MKDGEDGFLITPGNPQMLADSIRRLLDDDELRQRISDRVRARAPHEFSIETGCARVAELLKESLTGVPAVAEALQSESPDGLNGGHPAAKTGNEWQ